MEEDVRCSYPGTEKPVSVLLIVHQAQRIHLPQGTFAIPPGSDLTSEVNVLDYPHYPDPPHSTVSGEDLFIETTL